MDSQDLAAYNFDRESDYSEDFNRIGTYLKRSNYDANYILVHMLYHKLKSGAWNTLTATGKC